MSESTAQAQKTVEEENVAKANEFARIFSTGDIPSIVGALHPDAIYWVSGTVEGMSGSFSPKELGKLLSGVTGIYKNGALEITPLETTAQGDRVAVEAKGYAELVDGRTYEPTYHFLFRIQNGDIIEIKEYLDTHHAFETFFGK